MTVPKSYVEFVLGTLTSLLKDCEDMYPDSTKEFERDWKRLSSAAEHHGIEFYLVTMPAFRKHLDRCVSDGRLTNSRLNNFGPKRRGEPVPRLFRGLILRVFDRFGTLRPDADIHALRLLRQVLGFARKLKLECSDLRRRESVREYFSIEQDVPEPSSFWTQDDDELADPDPDVSFADISGVPVHLPLFESSSATSHTDHKLLIKLQQVADLMSSLIGEFDPYAWDARHGPGAVTDAKFGVNKYSFPNWSRRLDGVFPYADFGCANYQCWVDNVRDKKVPEDADPPARLSAVPKSYTTPRLIAVESVSGQWCQQIIRDFLYTRVQDTLLSSFISFKKQELNGSLALRASQDQSHATIDLSSASDRISCHHIERLFRRSKWLLHAMRASRAAWLHQDICRISPRYSRIRKYSTMGNATTFPVQSLFFLAAAVACELYARNQRVTIKNVRSLARSGVRVFGDDIITPNTSSGLLVDLLHHLGLKVNTAKTFEHGMFKESCGVDAFNGQDVTTDNVMDLPRRDRPGSIASSIDVHNNMIKSGYYRTAAYLKQQVERLGFSRIPVVKHGAGTTGWLPNALLEYQRPVLQERWCSRTQRRLVRVLTITGKQRRRANSGTFGVLQYFTEVPIRVTSAVSTLDYATRRAQVCLNLGWAPRSDMG